MTWTTKDWLFAAGIGGAGILLGALFFSRRKSGSFGRMELEAGKPAIPREEHCGCEIRSLNSKGGSTRYAAVCPSSPIPRYVKKEFALAHLNEKFCMDLLKPFSSLSGRWAADRRWAERR